MGNLLAPLSGPKYKIKKVVTAGGSKAYYPNMDLLRYILALAVIIAHTNELAGFNVPFPITSFDAVGGFFALSGFLMYPSFMKHRNLKKYTLSRARRILPPYFFIVIACAILLACVSTLSAKGYYLSAGFWEYLAANLSFLNWLHPELPGVFQGSEYVGAAVNGSLWTMKVEWCLYFSVPVFVWILSKVRMRKETLAIAVIILSILYRLFFSYLYYSTEKQIFNILSRQIFGQLCYFYCGMLVYFFLDRCKRHNLLLGLVGLVCYLISRLDGNLQIVLSPIGLSMLIMSICFLPYDLKLLRHRNNLSYDMYLFHFPLIQLSIYFGINKLGVWGEFSFVLISTILLSFIVNRLLENRNCGKKTL